MFENFKEGDRVRLKGIIGLTATLAEEVALTTLRRWTETLANILEQLGVRVGSEGSVVAVYQYTERDLMVGVLFDGTTIDIDLPVECLEHV